MESKYAPRCRKCNFTMVEEGGKEIGNDCQNCGVCDKCQGCTLEKESGRQIDCKGCIKNDFKYVLTECCISNYIRTKDNTSYLSNLNSVPEEYLHKLTTEGNKVCDDKKHCMLISAKEGYLIQSESKCRA